MDLIVFIIIFLGGTLFSFMSFIGDSDREWSIVIASFFSGMLVFTIGLFFIQFDTVIKGDVKALSYQSGLNSKDLIILSTNKKEISAVFNSGNRMTFNEKNNENDLTFSLDINTSRTMYSYQEINKNGKVNISYPKNYLCINNYENVNYKEKKLTVKYNDITNIRKIKTSKEFYSLDKIKENKNDKNLTFRLDKYSIYNITVKKEDTFNIKLSNKNMISGDFYLNKLDNSLSSCFKQIINIEVKDKDVFEKLKSFRFDNYRY